MFFYLLGSLQHIKVGHIATAQTRKMEPEKEAERENDKKSTATFKNNQN